MLFWKKRQRREREKAIEQPPAPARQEAPAEESSEAKELQRAVYGTPLVVHVEPSIGTADTPPPTEEVWPIHPGGITKQGEDMERQPHLPRVVPLKEEEKRQREE